MRVAEVGFIGEVLTQFFNPALDFLLLVLKGLPVIVAAQIVDFLLSPGGPPHLHFLFNEVEQELFVPHFVFVFIHLGLDLRFLRLNMGFSFFEGAVLAAKGVLSLK